MGSPSPATLTLSDRPARDFLGAVNFRFTEFSEVRQGFIGNSSLPGSLTNLLPANHYGSFIRMVPKAAVMGTPAESEGRSGGGA